MVTNTELWFEVQALKKKGLKVILGSNCCSYVSLNNFFIFWPQSPPLQIKADT